MGKPRSFLFLLCCFAVLPLGRAIAQDIRNQPCSFNGCGSIQSRYVPNGTEFMLNWSDGPKLTDATMMSDGSTQYASASLEDRWRYRSSAINEDCALLYLLNGSRTLCAQAQNAVPRYAISEDGIGPIKLGMTLFEAKKSFPWATFSRSTDGDGVALVSVRTKESQVMVLFAGERDSSQPIDWSQHISSIETSSPSLSTRLGVRPGDLIAKAERIYGKVQKIVKSEIESRQYAEFKNQPRGVIFRIDQSGIFADRKVETRAYRPSAKILSITIHSR